jgi:hypothetical protein
MLSTSGPYCPLLSKHLDEGAKTGVLHPDLLNSPRLCTERILSTPVQARPLLTSRPLCTAAENNLIGEPRGRTGDPDADRSSLRPAVNAGGATMHPRHTVTTAGDHP